MSSNAKPTGARLPSTLRHRREVFWQIVFPVTVVALLSLGSVVALYMLTGPDGTSVVADYSLILVLVPTCSMGIILLLINIGLIYLIVLLLRHVPGYTNSAQRKMQGVYVTVDSFTDKLMSGIVSALAVLRVVGSVVDKWSTNGDQPSSGDRPTGFDEAA